MNARLDPNLSPVALADVNGDGRLDIVAAGLKVLTGDGNGGFGAPVLLAVSPVEVTGDFNGDGRVDFAGRVGASGGSQISVLLNACGQPETNLAVQLTDSADPANEGTPITYTAAITNGGTVTATDVRLTTSFNGSAMTLDLSSGESSCSFDAQTRVFLCTLGSLAAGAVRNVTFTAVAGSAGTITATAGVTAAQADSDHGNNTDGETTTVNAAGRDIVVTNTNAFGPGSLLQAIGESNIDTGDVDRIVFNIPGTGRSRSLPPGCSR